MRTVEVGADGRLRCPKCGGSNFDGGRTFKAKAGFGLASVLLPKRLKCLNCSTWSKSGHASRPPAPSPSPPRASAPDTHLLSTAAADWTNAFEAGLLRDAEHAAGFDDLARGVAPFLPVRSELQNVELVKVNGKREPVIELVAELDSSLTRQQARALVEAVEGGPVLVAKRVERSTAVASIAKFRAARAEVALVNRF